MALTPERIAELERLKALMQQPATEAQRKAQAMWNAEQIAKRNVQSKSEGGGLEGIFARKPTVAERANATANIGLNSVFPFRKLGSFAAKAMADKAEAMRAQDPVSYDRQIGRMEGDANYVARLIQNRARKSIGLDPFPIKERRAEIGQINEDEFGKAKGGQISQDAMQLALMNKGGKPPKKTVKAYKMFRVDPKRPGQLFPLFVDADTPVPMNEWVDAIEGAMNTSGKVKSKIGPLAYRPGWHAGDLPLATHIGDKDEEQKAEAARINELRAAMLADIGDDESGRKIVNKLYPYPDWVNAPRLRNPRHIWAEIEMPHDVDWQTEATKRGYNDKGKWSAGRAHITDQLPKGGHYRYKTNSNMTGNWLISGGMKVNKILNDADVEAINKAAGTADLPRSQPLDKKKFGFAKGGVTHAHHLEIEERPL